MADFGYGLWLFALINITLVGSFILMLPYRRKSKLAKAFIVALFFAEMCGFPLTIFLLSWLVGYQNPLTTTQTELLKCCRADAFSFGLRN